jgi:hypothetical protein
MRVGKNLLLSDREVAMVKQKTSEKMRPVTDTKGVRDQALVMTTMENVVRRVFPDLADAEKGFVVACVNRREQFWGASAWAFGNLSREEFTALRHAAYTEAHRLMVSPGDVASSQSSDADNAQNSGAVVFKHLIISVFGLDDRRGEALAMVLGKVAKVSGDAAAIQLQVANPHYALFSKLVSD